MYAVCTPFVRRLYAISAYISTISVRCVLNLYDIGTKFACRRMYAGCTPDDRNAISLSTLVCSTVLTKTLVRSSASCTYQHLARLVVLSEQDLYDISTILVRYVRYQYDIWCTSVRYIGVHPAYIRRTSGVHPAYMRRTSGVHQAPPMYASPPSMREWLRVMQVQSWPAFL